MDDDQIPADEPTPPPADAGEPLTELGDELAADVIDQILAASEPLADSEVTKIDLAVARYRLNDHTREDLEALVDAAQAAVTSGDQPDDKVRKGLRHGLGHGEVVAAACEVLLGDAPPAPDVAALHEFSLALLEGASGPAAAGARVLLARCAEHDGDHRAMEAHIEAALVADPQYWPALLDAAWFAEDRGDAAKAISLFTETRVPAFEGEIERLERFHRSGDRKVGRNDPCPCGSGKKYKACCLLRGGFSLAERAGWLIDKAQGFVARSPQRPDVEALTDAAAGDFVGVGPDAYFLALDQYPMVVEVALFEAGLLRRFLDLRGHLLPADERELAERWLTAPLGVWRIAGPLEDSGIDLERDGETVRITRPGAFFDEPVGTAMLVRPLPMAELGFGALCSVVLPSDVVDAVGALVASPPVDPVAISRLIGIAEQLPPETVDGGDPLALCSASYRLPEGIDPDEAAIRLDAELVDPDGLGEWVEPADAPDPELVEYDEDFQPNGSIALFDDELLVRAASEVRFERLVEILERLVPEAVKESESRKLRADIVATLLAD